MFIYHSLVLNGRSLGRREGDEEKKEGEKEKEEGDKEKKRRREKTSEKWKPKL